MAPIDYFAIGAAIVAGGSTAAFLLITGKKALVATKGQLQAPVPAPEAEAEVPVVVPPVPSLEDEEHVWSYLARCTPEWHTYPPHLKQMKFNQEMKRRGQG